MDYTDIRVAIDGPVATITLGRPDRLNAVRVRTIEELVEALDRLDADDTVRAVILTGDGRAFCAGADLGDGGFELPTAGDPATGAGVARDPGGAVALRLFEMQKPVIAAINGAAVGFGASVLLPADRRVAATTARFAFPFVRRAIVPESCSSWFLPRLVGIPTALDWMLSGRMIAVEEAHRTGLVQEVVEPDQLLARAREIALGYVEQASPLSIGVVRRLLWGMLGADHPMIAHSLESRALVGAFKGPDAEEGWRSFLEKRPPQFASKPSTDLAFTRDWLPAPAFGELTFGRRR